jgi:streptogramin lyase
MRLNRKLLVFALFSCIVLSSAIPSFGMVTSSGQAAQPITTSFGYYQMIQYHLPNGSSSPWSITVDHLGRVWFVEQNPDSLVMFNQVNQTFTEFPIPGNGSESSTPESVTVDNSDNVWFSALTTNKLGELKKGTTSVIQYQIPGGIVNIGSAIQRLNCGPTIVKADPVGNVWIACAFSNQIDEFFPRNSTFFSYDLPVWLSAPAGFAFDNHGNLWFTAADTDMLGKAVLSSLRNGTDYGITEFAPSNSTYVFTLPHETGPSGSIVNISSSLPTPSGIALSPDQSTLWITEHVDSSFDSYDIATKSLVRYWTSQTYDKYGYSVSFPNGIAIDPEGNIWIGEHYGNKIAEFSPATDQLEEYPIPCCPNDAGGPYSIALGPNGTVWFVEISGAAIGELRPVQPEPVGQSYFAITLPHSEVTMDSSSSLSIPLELSPPGRISDASLNVSGISDTGVLINASASFEHSIVSFPSQKQVNDTLTLTTEGLHSGVYYLTVSATVPDGQIYSTILKVTVTQEGGLNRDAIYVGIIAVVLSVCVVGSLYALSKRQRRSRVIRRRRR